MARWRERAATAVPSSDLGLLLALVPTDGYAPDLMVPPPTATVMAIEDETASVAATDPDQVRYQLGIAFRGQDAAAEVAASFGGAEQLELHRREMPDVVTTALRDGYEPFAARVAAAIGTYFHHVLAPDWGRVVDVLSADIAHRADRMAQHGALALLDDLHPDLSWDGAAVVVKRPFDVEVDWAGDGLLLIPSVATGRRAWFNAERPTTPSVMYPARGTQHLAEPIPSPKATDDLGELLGHTRAGLLAALAEPRTTTELGRACALSAATVSYHLGILHRTGLVTRRRTGRRVVYVRTELARSIVLGSGPQNGGTSSTGPT
ncbi:winged helix-turn-helix domain-containing protein [Haloactinopolyspora alba]|uniref:winged helix-turn-helix domain-containing protein n=1 Tax=Haloactinopolyspora alba TaxID=648780 RepID=UPI0013ED62BF|nr:helix-turn-helix domain-containing protein [Haloactinopolyspora alba]